MAPRYIPELKLARGLRSSSFPPVLPGTYINCGGPSFNGIYVTWEADPLSSGESFHQPNAAVHIPYPTQETPLYTTMRSWGANDGAVNMYSIPVASPGHYWVRLYFAETMLQNVQQRSFSVVIEGAMVLPDFQLAAVGVVQVKEYFVPVDDGAVDIAFVRGVVGDPMISGISVTLSPADMYGLASDTETILSSEHRVSCGANSSYADAAGRTWIPDHGFHHPPSPGSLEFDQLFSYASRDVKPVLIPLVPDLLPPLLHLVCPHADAAAAAAAGSPPHCPPAPHQVTRTTLNGHENATSFALGIPTPVPLTYTFPVTPFAAHRVRLLLLENLLPFPNARSLNLSIDGRQVAAFVDVYSAAGFFTPLPLDFNGDRRCP